MLCSYLTKTLIGLGLCVATLPAQPALASLCGPLFAAIKAEKLETAVDAEFDFRQFIAKIPIHTEHSVDLKYFPGEPANFLGQGQGGGNAYVVRPSNGSTPFAVKEYIFGDRYDATNDVIGLIILKKVTGRNISKGQIVPVEVLDRIDETVVKLEYIAGTDVRRLASSLDATNRQKLARLFLRQLETLRRNFEVAESVEAFGTTYHVVDLSIRFSQTPGFKDLVVLLRDPRNPSRTVQLWIKPENVVMTSGGDIKIIDPR